MSNTKGVCFLSFSLFDLKGASPETAKGKAAVFEPPQHATAPSRFEMYTRWRGVQRRGAREGLRVVDGGFRHARTFTAAAGRGRSGHAGTGGTVYAGKPTGQENKSGECRGRLLANERPLGDLRGGCFPVPARALDVRARKSRGGEGVRGKERKARRIEMNARGGPCTARGSASPSPAVPSPSPTWAVPRT